MKTAMQDAIELVKKYDSRKISYNVLLGNLELLLEKEKEQIMDAFKYGWNWNFDAEKYYNETYTAPYHHKTNEFKDNDRIKINPITGDVKIITNE